MKKAVNVIRFLKDRDKVKFENHRPYINGNSEGLPKGKSKHQEPAKNEESLNALEDALYATDEFSLEHCTELALSIISYLKDSGDQVAQREITEDDMDLIQYITNMLYDAFTQGIKVRIPAGIGGGVRNVDSAEFDKWLEEQMTNIEEFLKSKEVTNETIEKWGDNMEEDLYERNHSREETRRIIENRIHGAKAMRDGLIKPIK